jgi:hypothetical protein
MIKSNNIRKFKYKQFNHFTTQQFFLSLLKFSEKNKTENTLKNTLFQLLLITVINLNLL